MGTWRSNTWQVTLLRLLRTEHNTNTIMDTFSWIQIASDMIPRPPQPSRIALAVKTCLAGLCDVRYSN